MNQFIASKETFEGGDSPNSAVKAGSSNASETSSGFKSFWKRSDKHSQTKNVTFVQQDPTAKRKQSRIGRLLKQGGKGDEKQEGEGQGQSEGQRRRQQVYQAQKRHRNRKGEYVQNLEAEVAKLQHLDAIVNSEKNVLAHQNRAIREFLKTQSLDAQIDALAIDNSSASDETSNDLSDLMSAPLDIRYDSELGQERVCLDLPDWTSSETSGNDLGSSRPQRHEPVKGDSMAALDFILALEWPCKDHVKHHAINPNATTPKACDVGEFHGHALTSTAAVLQSSLPPPGTSEEGTESQKWLLPHSEIDKLVELSELLQLDDELMTPAQAYSAIRETVPSDDFLQPTLAALKYPLSSLVQCHGFGACMDAAMFWQHLDGTLQSLHFTRPELGAKKVDA